MNPLSGRPQQGTTTIEPRVVGFAGRGWSTDEAGRRDPAPPSTRSQEDGSAGTAQTGSGSAGHAPPFHGHVVGNVGRVES